MCCRYWWADLWVLEKHEWLRAWQDCAPWHNPFLSDPVNVIEWQYPCSPETFIDDTPHPQHTLTHPMLFWFEPVVLSLLAQQFGLSSLCLSELVFFWLRCVLSGCHAVRQWCLSFCHWMARASFVCHHGYPAATQKGDATKSAIRWEISLQGYPAPFVHHVHAVDAVLGAMISFLADDSWKIHCKVNYIPSLLAIKLPCHGHLFPNASLHTYRETEGATEKETERSKEKEREKYRKKDREREVQKERKRIKNYTFFSFRSLSSSPYCENNSWE